MKRRLKYPNGAKLVLRKRLKMSSCVRDWDKELLYYKKYYKMTPPEALDRLRKYVSKDTVEQLIRMVSKYGKEKDKTTQEVV